MSNLLPKIDEEINCEKLLVITSEGEKLGILNKKDALKKAQTLGLNLILINETKTPDAPSVAKIMDKGKYLYELKIKNKKANQSGSSSKLKEILVKPQINHNDLSTYAKKAKE
jgi:translation initiation factor IF-3